MQFVYKGFTQDANIRSFQFEHSVRVSAFKTTRIAAVVNADLTLFSRARIAVQDGPALCLHILSSLSLDGESPQPLIHTVTGEDVAGFMALKTAKSGANPPHRRRKPPKPSSASQLRWPRV